VGLFDLLGGELERGGERVARLLCGGPAPAQPVAQLALLATGEGGNRLGIARALLDEGERLKHRVVQVGSHLGALLRADALGALGRQRPRQPPPERGEDEAEGGDRDECRQRHVAQTGEGAVGVEEEEPGAHDEGDAEAAAVERAEGSAFLVADGLGGRGGGGRRLRGLGPAAPLAPDQRRPGGGEHDGPHDCVVEQPAELAQREQQREDEQRDAGRGAAAAAPAGPGVVVSVGRGGLLRSGRGGGGHRPDGDAHRRGRASPLATR
jgi:hypothetical protein